MNTSTAGRISKRKNLHDGRPLWCDTPNRTIRVRQPGADEQFEIAIVGGGVSGAICALALSVDGHQVAVLDRRSPGEGSTLASTAMIQFEIDTPLIRLREKIGAKNANRAYRRSAKAVRDLSSLIENHGLQASWVDRDALYLAGSEMGFRGMMQEAAARRQIGLPSEFLSSAEVKCAFGFDVTGAILSNGAAELDPVRLTASCLRAAKRLGATVISPCMVTAVDTTGKSVRLSVDEGTAITARKVIFATGYEVVGGLPRDSFDIVSSWAIATKPISPEKFWPTRCLIWEAEDPYMYLRSTADNRVLIGGEDSGLKDPGRRAAAIPAKADRLLRKARRLLALPELEIDYSWAGAFADSPTGLPVFKELPGLRNVFAILGCGGNGITFSMIASDIVRQWAAGRRDPDAELFTGQ